MHSENGDDAGFVVLVSHEEQYCIWPSVRPVPGGWRQVGQHRSKSQCLAAVAELWTDMRPRSSRTSTAG
jgi:MbtH protein